jgi:hypothetical protein
VNEDRLREENERLGDQLRKDADGLERLRLELDAEIREGILGRLRGLCQAVRSTLQAHWPGAGGR